MGQFTCRVENQWKRLAVTHTNWFMYPGPVAGHIELEGLFCLAGSPSKVYTVETQWAPRVNLFSLADISLCSYCTLTSIMSLHA
jgi:hypothetical protein